jgi:hypothetical protein
MAPAIKGLGMTRQQVSLIPCATCGSLPTGEYPTVKPADDPTRPTVDDRRRYSCGPHEPIWPKTADQFPQREVERRTAVREPAVTR